MTVPANQSEIPDGRPRATPIYLVDASGNPISSSNPLNIGLAVDTLDAQVTNDGTFAKETGGNLATLAGAVSASKYQVNVTNANANGQNTMASSQSVAIASDQSPVATKTSAIALFTTAQTTAGTGDSGDIQVGAYREISIDITTTAKAGTNPTVQFFWYRKGADSIYYPLWQSDIFTLTANTCSVSIGAGMAYNQSLGLTGKLGWTVGGTATPTWSFSPNVYGK